MIGDDGNIRNSGARGDNARGVVYRFPLVNMFVDDEGTELTIDDCPIGNGDEVRCGVDVPEQLAESYDVEFVGDERVACVHVCALLIVVAETRLCDKSVSRSLRINSFPCVSKRATTSC